MGVTSVQGTLASPQDLYPFNIEKCIDRRIRNGDAVDIDIKYLVHIGHSADSPENNLSRMSLAFVDIDVGNKTGKDIQFIHTEILHGQSVDHRDACRNILFIFHALMGGNHHGFEFNRVVCRFLGNCRVRYKQ